MSSKQLLIRDSGNEMLAKRIIRINRENAHHTVRQAIITENSFYDNAVAKLTGLHFCTVSEDEVRALEILAKKKAVFNTRKWFIFLVLSSMPLFTEITWLPLNLGVVYSVVGGIWLLGYSLKRFVFYEDVMPHTFRILLHQRRLKKLEAKLQELGDGS